MGDFDSVFVIKPKSKTQTLDVYSMNAMNVLGLPFMECSPTGHLAVQDNK